MGLPLPRSERKIPTCLAVLTQCRSVTDSRTDGHACGQKLAQKEPILKGKQSAESGGNISSYKCPETERDSQMMQLKVSPTTTLCIVSTEMVAAS